MESNKYSNRISLSGRKSIFNLGSPEQENMIKELQKSAEKADSKDELKSNLRHKFYDFSKSIVTSLKKWFSRSSVEPEKKMVSVPLSSINRINLEDNERMKIDSEIINTRNTVTESTMSSFSLKSDQDYQELSDESRASYDTALKSNISHALNHKMVNIELGNRHDVHLGGTKPMKEYYGQDKSRWLSKQAVNCLGYYKKEGVLLTVAGANMQKLVDSATAVDAFSGRTDEDGEVSFQRRLDNVVGKSVIDLFKFSRHPELADNDTFAKVEEMGDQILREHITDWLMCNFDTKGENFIVTRGSDDKLVLHGIDKEAGFNKILSPGAQHMSTTYKPHANNTLYNVVFDKFAKGEMNLDLTVMKDKVNEIVNMDDDRYMSMFDDYLSHIREKDPSKYTQTYMNILNRKNNLGAEYNRFFTELVNERIENVKNDYPEEVDRLNELYLSNEGKKVGIFEEKQLSAVELAKNRITQLREDGFSKAGRFFSGDEGVREMLVAARLEKEIQNISSDKTITAEQKDTKIKEITSVGKIGEMLQNIKKNDTVKDLVKAVGKKEVNPAAYKNSRAFTDGMLKKYAQLNAVKQKSAKNEKTVQNTRTKGTETRARQSTVRGAI